MFRGPLPHPSHLQAYDRILPGSSHEILEMAKREQAHRHTAQRLEMLYPYLGLAAGFLGFLACIGGGILLALNDHDAVAGGMLGVPSLGVIGWFIHSRLSDAQERPDDGAEPGQLPGRSNP